VVRAERADGYAPLAPFQIEDQLRTFCPSRARRFRFESYLTASLSAFLFFSTAQTCAGQAEQNSTQKSPASQLPVIEADPSAAVLESGFHLLYGLDFKGARADFASYQKLRPDDPMGKAAEASSYLFEEFNSKGVLTSDFFLNDEKFLNGVDGSPEANANPPFVRANTEARLAAKKLLRANPTDTNAMLVLTMTDGMESDYDQVILKKQIPAVTLTRQAENEATALLVLDPHAQDAYVALGAGHYIIGCLPGYKRAFLWFGGIHGDKEKGMAEMVNAVQHGHYLRPFAKILLALAYRREKQPEKARPLLAELAAEFPTNTLFVNELALVDKLSCCKR
jgi:hypothetical protein